MAVSLRLIVDSGDRMPTEFLLGGQDAVVGRDPDADVLIVDATISGRHGILRAGAAGYTYTDTASRNGSALLHPPLAVRPLAAGEATPVGPDDVLLLGAADRPIRIRIVEGVAPYAAAPIGQRTVVASFPVSDVLVTPPDALAALAAHAIAPGTPEDLARAALDWLKSAVPLAEGWSVVVAGSGFTSTAGEALPEGLARAALERRDVVLLQEAEGELPVTASVVSRGMRAVLLAPLLAGGVWHGTLAAWSSLGTAALPATALQPAALASSLVALAASALAVRREGEEARRTAEKELRRLRGEKGEGDITPDPVGTSPAFLEALSLCRSIASSNVPVLLVGETGTGKEILARAIHRWSRRADKPFVAFNCAAVPETLLESELFGHVRGAFTGAGADRRGLFEEAGGGTIFLDEIGEMPVLLQAKFLRVLQDGEIRRVGSNHSSRVDVRVLSATNRDLWKQVESGAFRSDVLYRLNAVTVRIPSLRERRDDILVLAHHLLGTACRRAGKRIAGFGPDALSVLATHDFPGNVRELENELMRAVALTPEGHSIRPCVFSEAVGKQVRAPLDGAPIDGGQTLREIVESIERRAVEESLARAAGNVSQAARELGLTRTGLYKVMERLRMRGCPE
jgi:transcriptional regulator with GAF, ATPase, and Fis domain